MSGADEWNRAMDAIERADAKRARKAAKREEDARRTEAGKGWCAPRPWWDRPHGKWDAVERYSALYNGLYQDPRWRLRADHRRSLPWVGLSLWLDSHAQWRRLFSPRSLMTRVRRRMRRERGIAAARKAFSR